MRNSAQFGTLSLRLAWELVGSSVRLFRCRLRSPGMRAAFGNLQECRVGICSRNLSDRHRGHSLARIAMFNHHVDAKVLRVDRRLSYCVRGAAADTSLMPSRLTAAALMSDIGTEWTLNALSTIFSSQRKCSRHRILGRLSASAISAANRRHDEMLGHSPCFRLWQHFGGLLPR